MILDGSLMAGTIVSQGWAYPSFPSHRPAASCDWAAAVSAVRAGVS